jgi:hypothetical protein
MTIGEILDGAFRLYGATFKDVTLAVLLVLGVLQLLLSPLSASSFTFTPEEPTIEPAQIALAGAAGLVAFLVTPLVNGVVTWIAAERNQGRDVDWRDAYRNMAPRFATLLGASVLTGLIALGLMALAAVPVVLLGMVFLPLGILLGVVAFIAIVLATIGLLYVVVPVVVVEGTRAVEAIRRSFALLRPQFGRVLGIAIVAGLIVGIIGGIVGSVGTFGALVAGPVAWVVTGLTNALGQALTVPLAANVALLVYVDARVRQEGFDVELLVADVD